MQYFPAEIWEVHWNSFLGYQNCLLRAPLCSRTPLASPNSSLQKNHTKTEQITEEQNIVRVVFNFINGFKYLESTM